MEHVQGKKSVILIDDSPVIHKLIQSLLKDDPFIDLVQCFENGYQALKKIDEIKPDAVILDIEMPIMDGLQTLEVLQKKKINIPVIVFASMTDRSIQVTLEALTKGAVDFILKPSQINNTAKSLDEVKNDLLVKLHKIIQQTDHSQNTLKNTPFQNDSFSTHQSIEILTIASSTGGPKALEVLLSKFSKDFPVPILVAQHMPEVFTKYLAKTLDKKSSLKVEEAYHGAQIKAGEVWIAPGGRHMLVEDQKGVKTIKISNDAPVNSCRPSADILFCSVGQSYKSKSLAIVLTGMGKDGLEGSRYLKQRNGRVIIQDQESSVIWGMPGAVCQAGLADQIYSIEDMAEHVEDLIIKSRA